MCTEEFLLILIKIMHKILFITNNIKHLGLEAGDLLIYNENSNLFEMNKVVEEKYDNCTYSCTNSLKINYSEALDILALGDGFIEENTTNGSGIEQRDLEELNRQLKEVNSKLENLKQNINKEFIFLF